MPPTSPGTRPIWITRRALGLHLTLVVVVPVFLGLFWWQVQRVRQGNTLSWAYVFEWPFFTGYAVYLWWRLVHEQPGREDTGASDRSAASGSAAGAPTAPRTTTAVGSESPSPGGSLASPGAAEDEELAAYNRYLAELNATDQRKRW